MKKFNFFKPFVKSRSRDSMFGSRTLLTEGVGEVGGTSFKNASGLRRASSAKERGGHYAGHEFLDSRPPVPGKEVSVTGCADDVNDEIAVSETAHGDSTVSDLTSDARCPISGDGSVPQAGEDTEQLRLIQVLGGDEEVLVSSSAAHVADTLADDDDENDDDTIVGDETLPNVDELLEDSFPQEEVEPSILTQGGESSHRLEQCGMETVGASDVIEILLRRKDSELDNVVTPAKGPQPKTCSFISCGEVDSENELSALKGAGTCEGKEKSGKEHTPCKGDGCGSSQSSSEKNVQEKQSSLVKVDRGYCGKGPPGRGVGVGITKSYSIESSAPPIPPHHLHHYASHLHQNASSHARRAQLQQAVSQPSGVGLGGRRQPPRGSAADDSGNRNSRWRGSGSQGTGQGYELSQDLADMRLEMLERRYGGAVARRAAITIQRAYRHYAMYKKFRSITATAKAQEKRLSRRFTVDVPEWSEPGQHCHDAEHIIRSEFDQLQRNLSAAVYGEGRRPARSLSMRDSPRTSATGSITTTAATTRPQQDDNYDLHDTIASMSDSSLYCHVSAQSPLTPTTTVTPSHTHARNGSGDYQQQQTDLGLYASAKELKYFSSEDSGLGSQDSASLGRGNVAQRGVRPGAKKVPPEVPRRSSSIKSSESGGSIDRSADNGSMSSVQSSGSDSSLSQSNSDRATPLSTHDQVDNSDYHPTSPIWKRKNQVPEVVRKRQYRVGLNLFNKKPEKGITYLIGRGFLENSSQAVAKFLLTRKGLSKQMIGEYLGNLQNNFNMAVLECFAQEIDLSGMQVDVALRKFQTHFRMPGEAQKIERLVQVFAQRYCQCNRDIVAKLRDPETIFVMAFAIIMLNTDLHTASMKQEKRMKLEDFIKNLRGIDDGYDIEREMLEGMYQRIKSQEFRIGHDHVTQVLKVQQTMVGKKPNLALPHRRLVCYCRLYEIPDVNKRERVGVHQREVFLFNDLLVVTKIFSKKKSSVTYTFRQSFPLAGLSVTTKEVPYYPYLMEIRQRVDSKLLITFNARNEHDRSKFCEDLKESICEMDEMENLRIEGELERQKASLRASRPNSTTDNRDSGVADMELLTTCSTEKNGTLKSDSTLKRSALSNSLLDIHEAVH
ncbi:IQ motif and SEC7 domain-containing protein 1-like isoform X18 [Macrobrachium rosenbergii]|uniref:IQ motif and SEC7 domain-containing protein 1-like isoform X18 n=1 Tax=Macrobrachium rosenbergii TaxID=79674 RepID=UPI0034D541E8